MTDGSIHLRDIKVHRGGRLILDVERLDIPAGCFAGVIGTNGAGKTTLLRLCCGLIHPQRGVVMLSGTRLGSIGSWRGTNLRRYVGYVPQQAEYNADLPFTVREVVAMGRASARGLLRSLRRSDYDIVAQWLEKLGLDHRAGQTFASLSGGEQQKVLIARAMVQQPAILMLDEPGSNLDFNWKFELSRIVETVFGQTETTVVMVSHETGLLPPACRRIILLHDGKITADGTRDEVLNPDVLAQAYQCGIRTVDIAGRRYTAVEEKV